MTRPRSLLVLLCLLATVGLCPVAGWGHTFPVASEPRVGSTVDAPPTAVRIRFDAALEPVFSKVVVQDAQGRQVDQGDVRVVDDDPNLLAVTLPPLPPGEYRVIWSVVSRDGHRTEGDYTFTVK